MLVTKAYKVELDPNNKQRTLLLKHAGVARFVYNWLLCRSIEQYQNTGKSNLKGCGDRLAALKKTEFPWMYEVSSCVPTTAHMDLEKAFKHFFRRCKEKRGKPGFPRFKSKKRGPGGFGVQFTEVESDRIWLPRIGWVKLKEELRLPIPIKSTSVVRIKERAGRWFASVRVKKEIAVPENQGPVIGLDLGLKSFVADSDGLALGHPKFLRQSLKQLRRLSRQHSRKQKGSNNRKKSARELAKFHYRISCQRSDFLHKLSTILAKTKSVIAVEDLCIKGMVQNSKLARGISDSGWGEFVRQLEYKCPWYGSKLVKIGRVLPQH